ncbi:T-complex protein 11-like protein 1 [Hypsibius exemplaris]|uniref:T-complex protein 11-like protein 1 n=1 Tax=Hypsibius exemplaris TaxID=2072580 RepID=A0A1W0X4S2_HYPEX|nr:T-complex protein 11-like protein 1 [Hypsibius exemplaris]
MDQQPKKSADDDSVDPPADAVRPAPSPSASTSSPSRSPNRSTASSPRKIGQQTPAQLEQLMTGADRLERMILAHELAVNQDFTVDGTPHEGSLEAKIRETMHQAFWDVLQASLSQTPPDHTQALILLGEVKQTLLSFLPDGQGMQMREIINRNLDVEHIKEQIAHDAFDFREKAHFIISIMGRLCAPARDEEIKQLSTIEEIVPLFRAVFRILEEMKLDMLNFTLKQARPIINMHSIEYEQQMFDEFLATEPEPLHLTKDWLRSTAISLLESADSEGTRNPCASPPPSGSSSSSSSSSWKISPTRLLRHAFLNLLDWNSGPYPETLVADISRFLELQIYSETVVLSAATLLVIWNAIGSRITDAAAFKGDLLELIQACVENREQANQELMASVWVFVEPEIEKHLSADAKSPAVLPGLRILVLDLYRREHPVRQLLMKRLKESVEAAVAAGPASPVQTISPAFMPHFQGSIRALSEDFVKIISRNQTVFGRYYTRLITELAEELDLRVHTASAQSSPLKQAPL